MSSLLEIVSAALAHVAHRQNYIVVDEYAPEKMWHIAPTEDCEIFAELAEDRGVLVVSSPLGRPVEGRMAATARLALQYSHIWKTSGGFRLAQDGASGEFGIFLELAARGLTGEELDAAMKRFVDVAREWRKIVALTDTAEPAPATTAGGLLTIRA